MAPTATTTPPQDAKAAPSAGMSRPRKQDRLAAPQPRSGFAINRDLRNFGEARGDAAQRVRRRRFHQYRQRNRIGFGEGTDAGPAQR